MLVIP
jgi:hypothetical protein